MENRPGFLVGMTLTAIVVFCGCSSSKKENEVQKAKDSGKRQSASQFVKAKITRYYKTPEGVPQQDSREITGSKEVNRLASYFPGLGKKRESNYGSGWQKSADIWFFRDDGSSIRLSVAPALDTWAEGNGEWPVRDAKKFQAYFRKLFEEHEKK